ncbi:MAG: transcription termination factor NusA [bacterium]|nr:transcription termination factor NusA [bacterium]
MNGELLAVFEYLERERGISRDDLIEAVQSSLVSAARRIAGATANVTVRIDRETGAIRGFVERKVVETVTIPDDEIALDAARKVNPEAKVGDVIRREISAKGLGRIAAQTAKQVIIQRIRDAEHKIIFSEYKDRVGELLSTVVRRYERGDVILDLGKAEAKLPSSEQCPREGYGIGRRLKVYVVDVRETSKGPEIIVSRSHNELVRKLFELEVPEILEGTVRIDGISRDPGFRTKIAVSTTTEKVDPVGACVGMRGARVKDVVRELNGERVDIVRWSEDPVVFITNALSPARPREIKITGEREAEIIVDDDQFALALGKKGQGIRLVADLTGWRVDIKRASDREREEREAGVPVSDLPGLGRKVVAALAKAGYGALGDLRRATVGDLVKLPGIGDRTAEKIVRSAAEYRIEPPEETVPETAPAAEPAADAAPGEEPVGAHEAAEERRPPEEAAVEEGPEAAEPATGEGPEQTGEAGPEDQPPGGEGAEETAEEAGEEPPPEGEAERQ